VKPAIVRKGSVPSTQAVALELAEQGAPDRTVVIADHQTAGRGRRGARWEDEPGASLLMSIVLRPDLEPARLPTLSYVAAVAVAEALAAVVPVVPRLKWPNDVLVSSRKIAGILLETKLGRAPATTILGIGINLGQRQFPAALADRATSVAIETGLAVDREVLLTALLDRFDVWRRRLEAEGFDVVRQRWIALSDTIGRRVSVEGRVGIAQDLDQDGALILENGDGRQRVVAGEMRESCCS
jgi:BirA family transcriptional regulator, biotin operon repressor / biotin---[acetyl-CoA-carboxylase] ligase